MNYVLQQACEQRQGFYVHSQNHIHRHLCRAILFDSLYAARIFRKNTLRCNDYMVVNVTEKQLFVARLTAK